MTKRVICHVECADEISMINLDAIDWKEKQLNDQDIVWIYKLIVEHGENKPDEIRKEREMVWKKYDDLVIRDKSILKNYR